ncbi:MAG: negative regulator of sigma E activity [Pirellulaceae bacterium]|jgi:negative regulator of sigma E activity
MSRNEKNLELVSGYLDGTLSDAEQAAAEQLLRDSEEAQQLRVELEGLSHTLQSVTAVKLDASFHERVLAAATQELMSDRGAPYGQPVKPSVELHQPTETRHIPSWIAPLVAIAAAFLLAIGLSWLAGLNDQNIAQPNPDEINVPEIGPGTILVGDNGKEHQEEMPNFPTEHLLVIDLQVTKAGVQNKAFDHALARHGVSYDTRIDVTKKLEKTLLESRFLNKFVGANQDKTKSDVDLVLVVAKGQQFEDLWMDLSSTPDEISGYHFDLTIKPADFILLKQLDEAAEGRLALAKLPTNLLAKYLGRAQRLITNVALETRQAKDFINVEGPAAVAAANPPAAGGPSNFVGADETCRVLFVLHSSN